MEIGPGQKLLNYRLVDKIGEGGMGVVWRAIDLTLDREVAIKVLPDVLSRDTERLSRFEREARLLASLNHPNIATVHGLHEAEGVRFLAMELVAGEDLAALLRRGPLPAERASRIALQVAAALEAAHERGVIHRDLKPANIRISADGKAKVLDFGLAKAFDPAAAGASSDSSLSPTMTASHTVAGVILGTAGYMSPEQAAGQATDKRCDIWSYGVVLYEMLVGGRLFEGETVSHTLADVLRGEIDWGKLPPGLHPALRRLLERCMERDVKRRLRDIGEARVVLEDLASGNTEEEETPASTSRSRAGATSRWPWVVAFIALLVAAGSLALHLRSPGRPGDGPVSRFTLSSPNVGGLRQGDGRAIAISPDGRLVVNVGGSGGEDQLYLRRLDEFDPRPIEGTHGASLPTFSPDGRWLVYATTRGLWRVGTAGGLPTKLAAFPTSSPSSLTWSAAGPIYYDVSGELWRVSPGGGAPEPVLEPGADRGPLRQPCALPGGKALLVKTSASQPAAGEIRVLDLASGELRDLGLRGTDPRYLPTGHILYAVSEQVFAAGFDPATFEVVGTPIPVLDRAFVDTGVLQLDVATNGTLVYLPRAPGDRQDLVLVDRQGVVKPLVQETLPFTKCNDPRLSPDGKRLAVSQGVGAVWVLDLESETPTLMSESGFYPVWSPDGTAIHFASTRNRSYDLYRRSIDLSQPESLLLDRENNLRTAEWARDGSFVFREEIPGKGMDLRVWSDWNDETTIQPLLEGPDDELAPAVSPDGRWLAYTSNQSGRDEVYVTSFPRPGGRLQASASGGITPAWSPDGRELFYVEGSGLVSVSLAFEPGPRVVRRQTLFEGNYAQYRWHRQWDVHPDGEHFLMVENPPRTDVEVVLNWFGEMEQRLAASQ